MVNIAIAGAGGRMGNALLKTGINLQNIKLTGALEHKNHPMLGHDINEITGGNKTNIFVTSEFDQAAENCDVIIDFSSARAACSHSEQAMHLKKAMVIGVTGITQNELTAINSAAKQIAVLLSPNMSLGMNLLFSLVKQAAAVLPDYDIEIIEKHHRYKKDSPSGTALRIAEEIAEAKQWETDNILRHGRQGQTGERPEQEIGMHAIRAGDIVGEHNVLFGGEGERIEITHTATSREAFALGAFQAACWIVNQPAGIYTMQDVLNLK
jgi:4-hydroxy-tetrahydrodipicolinate reductase